jgi:hypothetical protein
MPTLIATAGATNANAYATVAWADAYHDENLRVATWHAASTADRQRALIMATRLLDTHVVWFGTKVSSTQSLLWPMVLNQEIVNAETIVSTTIPVFLQQATAEFARSLLEKDRVSDPASKGIREIGAGATRVTFDWTDRAGVVPEIVERIILPYGRPVSSSYAGVERV